MAGLASSTTPVAELVGLLSRCNRSVPHMEVSPSYCSPPSLTPGGVHHPRHPAQPGEGAADQAGGGAGARAVSRDTPGYVGLQVGDYGDTAQYCVNDWISDVS